MLHHHDDDLFEPETTGETCEDIYDGHEDGLDD